MSQPAYGKSYPFESGSGQQAGSTEYRHMGTSLGDGIINDVAGDAFRAVASGSDRTIAVDLDELRVRGIHFEGVDATTTITLTAPSAGFTRADRIVAHYDPSDKSIVITKHEGSAVNTGVPAPPALDRNSGGTWDLPLWWFTGGTGAASTLAKVDERTWIGWQGFAASKDCLPDTAPIGSRFLALDTGHEWVRQLVVTTPTWVDLDEPAWTDIGRPGSVVPSGQSPQYSRTRGLVRLQGGYAKTDGTNFAAGGGTAGSYSLGQLPEKFRPGQPMNFTVDHGYTLATIGIVRVSINQLGVMTATVAGGAVSSLRIDGISFPAEN